MRAASVINNRPANRATSSTSACCSSGLCKISISCARARLIRRYLAGVWRMPSRRLPSSAPSAPNRGAATSSQVGVAKSRVPLHATVQAEAKTCANMPTTAPQSARRTHAWRGIPARYAASVPANARQKPAGAAQTRSGMPATGATTTRSASSSPAQTASHQSQSLLRHRFLPFGDKDDTETWRQGDSLPAPLLLCSPSPCLPCRHLTPPTLRRSCR